MNTKSCWRAFAGILGFNLQLRHYGDEHDEQDHRGERVCPRGGYRKLILGQPGVGMVGPVVDILAKHNSGRL